MVQPVISRFCVPKEAELTSRTVTSWVLCGLVLSPFMFLVCIWDVADRLTSYAYLFANDTKLMKPIRG